MSMERLRMVTYLGPNTLPIARELAAALGMELIAADVPEPIEEGMGDLYWMCGLLTVELIDSGRLDAEIVAAPVFPGQLGPTYHSVVVATSSATDVTDLSGRRLVINEGGSWSGNHALRVHLAGSPVSFASVVESGAHAHSIDMLLAGDADVAAIDHTIWEHRLATDPAAHSLVVVDRTRNWPAPPFSASRRLDEFDALRRALIQSDTGRPGPHRRGDLDRLRPDSCCHALRREGSPRRPVIASAVDLLTC
jgi:ABC-type phosphate/phosphonate transport system substrate-binding protein